MIQTRYEKMIPLLPGRYIFPTCPFLFTNLVYVLTDSPPVPSGTQGREKSPPPSPAPRFFIQVNPRDVTSLYVSLHCSSKGLSRSSSFPLPSWYPCPCLWWHSLLVHSESMSQVSPISSNCFCQIFFISSFQDYLI